MGKPKKKKLKDAGTKVNDVNVMSKLTRKQLMNAYPYGGGSGYSPSK